MTTLLRLIVASILLATASAAAAQSHPFSPTLDHFNNLGHTATVLGDGRVLIVGEGVEIYDPATDLFTDLAELVPLLHFRYHTATMMGSQGRRDEHLHGQRQHHDGPPRAHRDAASRR